MADKWSTDDAPAVEPDKRPAAEDELIPTGPTTPTLGVNPPDTVDQLRTNYTAETRNQGDYWVLGAHGGAGESTIAALDPHAKAAGHVWPINPAGQDVVLVARESIPNLRAAQCAGQHWGSGTLPGVRIIAFVTIPAHPGRSHRNLERYLRLVAGGFPIHLRAAWHQDYQNHLDPRKATKSNPMAKVIRDLHRISTRHQKGNTP